MTTVRNDTYLVLENNVMKGYIFITFMTLIGKLIQFEEVDKLKDTNVTNKETKTYLPTDLSSLMVFDKYNIMLIKKNIMMYASEYLP